ncbi:hypothetical protein PR048_010668 [Dryococelus australis]|uniref:Uncharacterized protein n=1 Tax=Dryococelus australis TaxID=614101 RepID=A0ABQ9I3C4_9NEOP|nr:hypothetical protein PR048_010668 [Dryococelus australis]
MQKKIFDNRKKAVNTFYHHSKTQYHLNCVRGADELLSRSADQSIEMLIDEDRLKKPIIDTIITRGRQELSLCGHRDAGIIHIDTEVSTNEGSFHALIRYRALGDTNLKHAMESEGLKNY